VLVIEGISKQFDRHPLLQDVRLRVAPGEILGLLGPSGCGKTTLLRIIAGLEPPDAGRVVLNGTDITRTAPHRRRIGMMFQDYALFPHKTVLHNVAYGLELLGLKQTEVQRQAVEMLERVGLAGFEARPVSALSGGEQQRVALARSLAPNPAVLLLDEPLGSLDRSLRERLMLELRRILKAVGATAVSVTHDQAEAFALSDRVAVLQDRHLAQVAVPEQLYLRPANAEVARFLGFSNLLPARVRSAQAIETVLGTILLEASAHRPGESVTLLIRPDGGRLVTAAADPGEFPLILEGTVQERLFQGPFYRLALALDDGSLLVFQLPLQPSPPPVGSRTRIAVSRQALHLMKKE